MSDIIFVNGLSAKKPHENAPSFVIADISVKVADLHEWLNHNQGLANDSGYINLSLKESKAWNFYIEVNDFKPEKPKQYPPKEEYYTREGGEKDDVFIVDDSGEIPF